MHAGGDAGGGRVGAVDDEVGQPQHPGDHHPRDGEREQRLAQWLGKALPHAPHAPASDPTALPGSGVAGGARARLRRRLGHLGHAQGPDVENWVRVIGS